MGIVDFARIREIQRKYEIYDFWLQIRNFDEEKLCHKIRSNEKNTIIENDV